MDGSQARTMLGSPPCQVSEVISFQLSRSDATLDDGSASNYISVRS